MSETLPWRCPICRMPTNTRLFHVPLCGICRDQVQDFIWVSLVMTSGVVLGVVGSMTFAVEEVALFGLLVLAKHRLPNLFEHFVEHAP